MQKQVPSLFIIAGILTLLMGMLFGVLGSLQYIFPGLFKESLNFTQLRPLHVTLVITWIFSAAMGGIYYYLQQLSGRSILFENIARAHFVLFIITGIVIIFSYLNKNFGGREYFEYPPVIAIPVLLSWILFIVNCIVFLKGRFHKAPVYIWMWATGLIFFLFTLIESYLWMIPFFRDSIVRDLTVQWKAMGSMVGSWNMLVYGTGFYIMEKISADDKVTRSPVTFFFYFLGLVNLMFNWGHHTYIVPASDYVRNIAYIVSMTELLILGFIIKNWSATLSDARKNFNILPRKFLSIADFWIFLNLILAILISIPAVNRYTHGTHITVAHSMGATIGINTMILFSSLFYIASQLSSGKLVKANKMIVYGFWISNVSLFVFWLSLIGAGSIKIIETLKGSAFQTAMVKMSPWFHLFSISGYGVFIGLIIISLPLLPVFWKQAISTKS